MDFRFAAKDFEELYTDEKGAQRYPAEVVDGFFEVVAIIAAARDERDLRNVRSLRFEKLKTLQGYSLRLSRQWRLELDFDASAGSEKVAVILRISKHYGE